ncbi:MAG TPA: fused MFS/spermidine synthase [bacterium]|nr:fused MFS/spermidine synthase [bacterium]
MLPLAVVVSGAVLLALEITASRVVAPVLGNSIYVWGALIGVFLAALAVGYAVGGRVADRFPTPGVFAALAVLAGLAIAPIPLFAPALLEAVQRAGLGPRAGPLAATAALFFPPAVALGMISPFAVRLGARTMATLGNVAGSLYALSTLGSIGGTLLAAFLLLDWMSARTIVVGLGLVMLALGALLLVPVRRLAAAAAIGLTALVGAGALLAGSPDAPGLVFARDTVYHRITVNDEAGVRYLRLDAYWQSGMDLRDPRRTVFPYADYLHLPLLFQPDARRVLFVGLGGGTAPRRYHEDYPQLTVDVVELDPAVIEAATRFFGVPRDGRMRLVAADGRLFVAAGGPPYDIIILDAFLIDTIPFHLATREFFADVRSRLAPGGVLASNIIGALEGPRSGFFRAVYKTLGTVFPSVYVFPTDWSRYDSAESLRNIIVVATQDPPRPRAAVLRAAGEARRRTGVTIDRFLEAAGDLYAIPVRTDDVPVLTDDYAPVDRLLLAR